MASSDHRKALAPLQLSRNALNSLSYARRRRFVRALQRRLFYEHWFSTLATLLIVLILPSLCAIAWLESLTIPPPARGFNPRTLAPFESYQGIVAPYRMLLLYITGGLAWTCWTWSSQYGFWWRSQVFRHAQYRDGRPWSCPYCGESGKAIAPASGRCKQCEHTSALTPKRQAPDAPKQEARRNDPRWSIAQRDQWLKEIVGKGRPDFEFGRGHRQNEYILSTLSPERRTRAMHAVNKRRAPAMKALNIVAVIFASVFGVGLLGWWIKGISLIAGAVTMAAGVALLIVLVPSTFEYRGRGHRIIASRGRYLDGRPWACWQCGYQFKGVKRKDDCCPECGKWFRRIPKNPLKREGLLPHAY